MHSIDNYMRFLRGRQGGGGCDEGIEDPNCSIHSRNPDRTECLPTGLEDVIVILSLIYNPYPVLINRCDYLQI